MASPRSPRLTLTGILAAPDDFGRLRVLLMARAPDGKHDPSCGTLLAAVPKQGWDHHVPYEVRRETPFDDGVRGEVSVVVPARHRQHWMESAGALRGRWVRVEATVRPYSFRSGDGAGRCVGTALDLALLSAL